MVNFGISGVEFPGYGTRELVMLKYFIKGRIILKNKIQSTYSLVLHLE
jgi:uncharacterized sodium:solute symporter family permease YidK